MKAKLATLTFVALALAGCAQPQADPAPPPTPNTYCQSLTHEQCTIELTDKMQIALDTFSANDAPTSMQESAYRRLDDMSRNWAANCTEGAGMVAGDSYCSDVARDLTGLISTIDPALVPVFRQ